MSDTKFPITNFPITMYKFRTNFFYLEIVNFIRLEREFTSLSR